MYFKAFASRYPPSQGGTWLVGMGYLLCVLGIPFPTPRSRRGTGEEEEDEVAPLVSFFPLVLAML